MEDLLKVMEEVVIEKGVPKDELGSRLGVIEIRLGNLEERYGELKNEMSQIRNEIIQIHTRIDKIHERMDGVPKLIISQTKWMVGSIIFVGTLISVLMSIFRFV